MSRETRRPYVRLVSRWHLEWAMDDADTAARRCTSMAEAAINTIPCGTASRRQSDRRGRSIEWRRMRVLIGARERKCRGLALRFFDELPPPRSPKGGGEARTHKADDVARVSAR